MKNTELVMEKEWQNQLQHNLLDTYSFCHIISYMPYFYQTKFKRLNKYTFKWIEYQQKKTIIQRILKGVKPHYYEDFKTRVKDCQKVFIDIDDFKYIEKTDYDKYGLHSYFEDPEQLLKMIRKLYYLHDYEWLLYWNNVGDKFYDQETVFDTELLFDKKYLENYELEGTQSLVRRKFLSNFILGLTIVGLQELKTDLNSYLKQLYDFGFEMVEFLFCRHDLMKQEYSNYYCFPYFTNCFVSVHQKIIGSRSDYVNYTLPPIKSNISSIKRARKYLLQCANVHGVHPSLIPRGDLFVYSLFDKETKSKINWEQVKIIYGNSILPVYEKLVNPSLKKIMDITQYLFEPIVERARATYLSENSESKFLTSLNQFQLDPLVKENKERLEYLFKLIDEDCFKKLSNYSKSIPQLVKSIDFETKTKFQKFHLHTKLQIKKYKLESFKLYSWETDFFDFIPKKEEPSNSVAPLESQKSVVKSQKKKKFTKVIVESANEQIKY